MKSFSFHRLKISWKKYLLVIFLIVLVFQGFSPRTCFADDESIKNKNSVVIVYTYDKAGSQIGQASGFIVRKDGVVVTNYHIISKAASIKIKVEDTIMDVKGLLYIDMDGDIAMLKTEGDNLPSTRIMDADISKAGQKIYLIGSPDGEEKKIFNGTLDKIKYVTPEKELLLISAPVSKGCSGGPVFNEKGEVIGIATFFGEEAQQFYFAMPVFQIRSRLSLNKVIPLDKAGLIASEDTAEYWFNLAAAYESLGLYNYASGAYQNAIRIKPESATAHNKLGMVYTILGIYSFAIKEHNEAIRLKPDYQEAYYNLGMAYIKSDMIQKAAETFDRAIKLKPDDAKSYINLAFAYFKTGRLEESVEVSKQAILIKPDFPEAYYNLGAVYYQMKMYPEAIEALKQLISLKPDAPEVHLRLGILYSRSDTALALKEYEILKSLDPNSATELYKIIQSKKNIFPETSPSSEAAAKEKIRHQEESVVSQKITSSAAATEAQPKKNELLIQTTDASKKGPAPSDGIDITARSSGPDKSQNSDKISTAAVYSVQVGVFKNKNNAESLVNRLEKDGYNVFVQTEFRDDQILYRILVGRFSDKATALKISGIILKKEKLKPIILKH